MTEAAGDALQREVVRVADRLRSLSEVRLSRAFPPDTSRHAAALGLAQQLADLAQGVEERHSSAAPESRAVPDLGPFAVGDQVGVTGNDLVAAASIAGTQDGGHVTVWLDGQRRPLADVVAQAIDALRDLRHRL